MISDIWAFEVRPLKNVLWKYSIISCLLSYLLVICSCISLKQLGANRDHFLTQLSNDKLTTLVQSFVRCLNEFYLALLICVKHWLRLHAHFAGVQISSSHNYSEYKICIPCPATINGFKQNKNVFYSRNSCQSHDNFIIICYLKHAYNFIFKYSLDCHYQYSNFNCNMLNYIPFRVRFPDWASLNLLAFIQFTCWLFHSGDKRNHTGRVTVEQNSKMWCVCVFGTSVSWDQQFMKICNHRLCMTQAYR